MKFQILGQVEGFEEILKLNLFMKLSPIMVGIVQTRKIWKAALNLHRK